jgi:hypothetical protein
LAGQLGITQLSKSQVSGRPRATGPYVAAGLLRHLARLVRGGLGDLPAGFGAGAAHLGRLVPDLAG